MIASYIVLADSPTETAGREITEANVYNFDEKVHHATTVKVGTYEIKPSDAGTRYVNLVAYSASTAASPGDTLRVEQDYGRLSVIGISD